MPTFSFLGADIARHAAWGALTQAQVVAQWTPMLDEWFLVAAPGSAALAPWGSWQAPPASWPTDDWVLSLAAKIVRLAQAPAPEDALVAKLAGPRALLLSWLRPPRRRARTSSAAPVAFLWHMVGVALLVADPRGASGAGAARMSRARERGVGICRRRCVRTHRGEFNARWLA